MKKCMAIILTVILFLSGCAGGGASSLPQKSGSDNANSEKKPRDVLAGIYVDGQEIKDFSAD